MEWKVEFHEDFLAEFGSFNESVQDQLLAKSLLLKAIGPQLKRPHSDTLAGSQIPNLKELRFTADDGVWRVAYAFDPQRKAILLVAGDKSGIAQKRFYKELVAKAESRFAAHLATLKAEGKT